MKTTGKYGQALHATLAVKRDFEINQGRRRLLDMKEPQYDAIPRVLKIDGVSADGVEMYINIELIGSPEVLSRFGFQVGKHVGLVLRAID